MQDIQKPDRIHIPKVTVRQRGGEGAHFMAEMTETEIKIGTVCNNNCTFCLNEERNKEKSLTQIEEEIARAKKAGINNINFTGGEITIRPDFSEILDFAAEKQIRATLQTNGRMFYYKEFCEKTVKIGVTLFLISLHAHNEELNRRLTNTKNAYYQTTEGIRNLVAAGQNVQINTVVCKQNLPYLEEIAKHHIELGIKNIQFSWARPQGKALQKIKETIPVYSEGISKLKKAILLVESHKGNAAVLGVPFCLMGKHTKNCGNAYLDSVLVKDNVLLEANELSKQRKSLLRKCLDCEFKEKCGGVFKKYIETYGEEEFA
jgi:MoaA/NifB/PqqE/SkfB family radical SAM enzyme